MHCGKSHSVSLHPQGPGRRREEALHRGGGAAAVQAQEGLPRLQVPAQASEAAQELVRLHDAGQEPFHRPHDGGRPGALPARRRALQALLRGALRGQQDVPAHAPDDAPARLQVLRPAATHQGRPAAAHRAQCHRAFEQRWVALLEST
ncbi:hypothetical protein AVEN_176303-1 [Araneus ventricosus]|uniref:Uncharacterized protein n=1 Tax=Araneus ventricosus TaxID=182803 RepID=A0A4Y2KQ20_ARAVE|nr:hypothetical protein AVEN_1858-1 [Araneus ventricosus]GBN03561.1 hypothetical protein AVEN_148309-1 [Araneus ventricosus]GBN03570.1 hypothetical protein AVEN_157249-1 [Araneus ventricosus]GBN03583.1 hypothetical protein AVEN_176303-1 [Araneus ventricosus]